MRGHRFINLMGVGRNVIPAVPSLPAGVMLTFQPAAVGGYDLPTRTIKNLAAAGQTDPNISLAPRRQFANGVYYGHFSTTVADSAVAAPDGSVQASTVVASSGTTWGLVLNVVAYGNLIVAGQTYTAAITVKDLSGGVSPNFRFGDFNSSIGSFAASSSYQRFTQTFVAPASPNIAFYMPAAVQGANFAVVDFEIFPGSADLNPAPLSAKPRRVANGDMGLHRDFAVPVSGGALLPGTCGLLQVPAVQTVGPYTLVAVAQRTGSGNFAVWQAVLSKISSYLDFTVGYTNSGAVGTNLNNNLLDRVPAWGGTNSPFLAPQQNASDNIFGCGAGPFVIAFRYDGARSNIFVNGIKLFDNAVSVASATWIDAWISSLTAGVSFYSAYSYREIDYWSRALSDAEVNTACLSVASRTSIPATNLCIFQGTSLMAGLSAAAGGGFAYIALPNLTTKMFSANFGVASSGLGGLIAEAPTINALLTTNSGFAGLGKKILCMDGLTNDLNDKTYGSVATLLANFQSYLLTMKAAGWKTVVSTVLSRGQAGVPASFDADRATFNSAIKTWGTTYIDAIADFASDAAMGPNGAWSNTTYFAADNVHWTDAGHAKMEPYTSAAINLL